MGNSVSRVVGCFIPVAHDHQRVGAVFFSEPFDEGLGHSFCYIRPSLESPHLSPSHSHRYAATVLPSADLDARSSSFRSVTIDRNPAETAAFKSISGASVSANASTLHTILSHDQFHSFTKVPDDRHAAFESTASFTCLPLQPVPRGFTFSGPISATTFSGPMSGPLQVRNFMLGPVEQQQRGLMSAPLERGFMSGPLERGLVSVPLERGFMSGPLERGCMSGSIDTTTSDRSHFSAPLGEPYHYRRMTRRRRSISRLFSLVGKPVKGALTRNISSTLSRTHKSIVTPIRQFVWHRLHNGAKEAAILYDSPSELRYVSSDADPRDNHSLQWAQGKAGEDRVHVVVSADHGWLFVGIYDGFNGPDAPDFLMRNLYRAVNRELQGLLWDNKEGSDQCKLSNENDESGSHVVIRSPENDESNVYTQRAESDSIQFEVCSLRPDKNDDLVHTYTLKEYLDGDFTRGAGSKDESVGMQEPPMPQPVIKGKNMDASPQIATNFENFQQEGLTCNHSIDGRSATGSQADVGAGDSRSGTEEAVGPEDVKFKNNSIDMDINHSRPDRVSTVWSGKSFMRLSFRHRQIKNKESHRKFLPRRYDSLNKRKESEKDDLKEGEFNPWRQGAVDHDAVLRALARALEVTEEAYLNMADHVLEENPELALMGSCILVALMKDKDLYVLNVGDSRAIVAQQRSYDADSAERSRARDAATQLDLEHFSEESSMATEASRVTSGLGPPASSTSLNTLQLSMDHNTSIEEEIRRIKAEHPDDNMCILNGRVKGRLKVTRAFGAGFLKKPRWNNAILKMFQIDYVGSAPYVSCAPALHHHRLGPSDRFLILSSDGLYQYFSNQEAVSHVEWFMEKYPEGDPAQHLIEELLFRAAKKAGMDFHELLDIPQGERRKYHDDVSVMVISLEGRIWRSSG